MTATLERALYRGLEQDASAEATNARFNAGLATILGTTSDAKSSGLQCNDAKDVAHSQTVGIAIQDPLRPSMQRRIGTALNTSRVETTDRLLPAMMHLRDVLAHQPPSRSELATGLVAAHAGSNSRHFEHWIEAYLANPRQVTPPFGMPVLDDEYATRWQVFGDKLGGALGPLFDERIRQAETSDGFWLLKDIEPDRVHLLLPKVVYRGSGDTFGGMHFTKEWEHAGKIDNVIVKVDPASGENDSPMYVMLNLADLLNEAWPRRVINATPSSPIQFFPPTSNTLDGLVEANKQTLFEADAIDDMSEGADQMRWSSTPWTGSGKLTNATVGHTLGEYFGQVVARELATRSYDETALQRFNQKAADFVSGLKCIVPLWCGIEAAEAGKRAEAVEHFMLDLANIATFFIAGPADEAARTAGLARGAVEGALTGTARNAVGSTSLTHALEQGAVETHIAELDVHDANSIAAVEQHSLSVKGMQAGSPPAFVLRASDLAGYAIVKDGEQTYVKLADGYRRLETLPDGTVRFGDEPPLNPKIGLRGGLIDALGQPLLLPEGIEEVFVNDASRYQISDALVREIRLAYHFGAPTLDLSEVVLQEIPVWLRPSSIETLVMRPGATLVIDPLNLSAMNNLRIVGGDVIRIGTRVQHNLGALPTLGSIEIADAANLEYVDLTSVRALAMRVHNAPRLTSLSYSAGGLTHVELSDVPGLVRLDLSQNALTHHDLVVSGREAPKLPVLSALDLSLNELTQVPHVVEEMPQLRSVFLSNNQLSGLGPLMKAEKLQSISIAYNLFTELPTDLACNDTLMHYVASGNAIASLKPDISRFVKLWKLGLSDNHLAALPDELVQLRWLREFIVDGNPFVTRPAVLDRLLPQLDAARSRLPH
ncbi:leucine-rich repeat domain-containing protein [Pararobbsia alpina]|uniref:leucine-rich repeat domain-containing protein n=1 Tax=Pararobbsia alpina TaxID=621374 RepID=UPI0039A5845C